jgi:myo-inositol-1(or 4)-monophosphatase
MTSVLFTKTDLREVERIARGAGKILLRMSGIRKPLVHKGGGAGLITDADKASEDFILRSLARSFPGTNFLSEEAGFGSGGKKTKKLGVSGDTLWIIDPLDGTNNYAHQFPWYCVSIGLEFQQNVALGVIYHPVLDEMFSAIQGKGARLNGKKIFVSGIKRLKDALLTVGFYYYKDEILQQEVRRFGRVHQQALGIRRPGSAALDMAYVSCGRMDGFWERGLNPWDMAAGKVIALEAGALLSDYQGNAFSIYEKELLMTNGLLHKYLIPLLK